MIVYVNPDITGNVFIRERPDRDSPSVRVPAYNYRHYGCLYEIDRETEVGGAKWYHVRGLGWTMASYYTVFDETPPQPDTEADTVANWVIGLTRSEAEQCIEYLQSKLDADARADTGEGVD